MKAIELFAGVGGFRLGLENNNIQVIYANEFDKYAAETYDKNFPDRIDRRDITTVPVSDIPDHDLLVGGFPCQAFSVAGKRHGFNETRGTLFFDVARILKDKRPRHLILENVKGLLTHDFGKTYQVIIGVLADLGYRVEWCVLNSKNFGVPQNRERIYIVGHLREECAGQVFPLREGGSGNFQAQRGSQEEGQRFRGNYSSTVNTRFGSTARGQQLVAFNRKDGVIGEIDVAGTLNAGDYRGLNRNQTQTAVIANTIAQRDYKGGNNLLNAKNQIRRLTPTECERLQGFPDGWTAGVSDTQRYKQMGNAVTVNVVDAVARQLMAICYS